ncbi:MAG: nitroreductase family protein [Propionibacteriaceae bacterium]
MELSEAVRRRRMVRDYDPTRAVPAEAVEAILTAALRAPSAGHTQGVSFLVLQEPAQVEAFWDATASAREPDRWLRGMQTAPVLVLVWTSEQAYLDRYARPDKGWDDRDPARWSAPYWYVDAGMASMSALLTAVDHELGACFFGVPPDRQGVVGEVFGVPEDQLSVGVISLGYPAAEPRRSPARSPRRDRGERIHLGRWEAHA